MGGGGGIRIIMSLSSRFLLFSYLSHSFANVSNSYKGEFPNLLFLLVCFLMYSFAK